MLMNILSNSECLPKIYVNKELTTVRLITFPTNDLSKNPYNYSKDFRQVCWLYDSIIVHKFNQWALYCRCYGESAVVIEYAYISVFNCAIYAWSAKVFTLIVRDNPVSH
jgi:hypothetical protein